jgi:beta-phosphoglucomutase-like phosphatase (HAD superfamily)
MKQQTIKRLSKKYRAIIFDLDGTLINSLPLHVLAFKDLMLERGIRLEDYELERLMGKPTTDIFRILKKKYKFKESIDVLREERRYHYFKFLGLKNIVFPGVLKSLQVLILNYKLALATGSSYVTYTHSTDKDFQILFDVIITSNSVRHGKPAPDQFLLCAKKLRIKPKECLVIGDSLYDAIAAKRAGMDFIGTLTGYNNSKTLLEEGAIAVIKNIPELLKLI